MIATISNEIPEYRIKKKIRPDGEKLWSYRCSWYLKTVFKIFFLKSNYKNNHIFYTEYSTQFTATELTDILIFMVKDNLLVNFNNFYEYLLCHLFDLYACTKHINYDLI